MCSQARNVHGLLSTVPRRLHFNPHQLRYYQDQVQEGYSLCRLDTHWLQGLKIKSYLICPESQWNSVKVGLKLNLQIMNITYYVLWNHGWLMRFSWTKANFCVWQYRFMLLSSFSDWIKWSCPKGFSWWWACTGKLYAVTHFKFRHS